MGLLMFDTIALFGKLYSANLTLVILHDRDFMRFSPMPKEGRLPLVRLLALIAPVPSGIVLGHVLCQGVCVQLLLSAYRARMLLTVLMKHLVCPQPPFRWESLSTRHTLKNLLFGHIC